MTELARTPPALRRLFRLVDLGPKPHDEVTKIGLDLWRKERGGKAAPSLQALLNNGSNLIWSHALIVEPIAGRRDYALIIVGNSVAGLLGIDLSEQQFSQITNSRLAARLRRLFELATERGEAVLVQFVDRIHDSSEAQIEALAAPVIVEGRGALLCILSCTPLHPSAHA
jgi:hypothetical protein